VESKVDDLKYVYPVAVMFIPLPFFWALFDMQGSRWTLTATQGLLKISTFTNFRNNLIIIINCHLEIEHKF
jgi:hypothetical protein